MDWTNHYDRKQLVEISNKIIEELIKSIHSSKLSVYESYNLTVDEIGIILRWPIYVSVNTFIERYIRAKYYHKKIIFQKIHTVKNSCRKKILSQKQPRFCRKRSRKLTEKQQLSHLSRSICLVEIC